MAGNGFSLDANHYGVALATLAAALWLAVTSSRFRTASTAPVRLVYAFAIIAAIAGLFMLARIPGLDAVSRIAYSIFDLALLTLAALSAAIAIGRLLRRSGAPAHAASFPG
jgi:hypothetical protein